MLAEVFVFSMIFAQNIFLSVLSGGLWNWQP